MSSIALYNPDAVVPNQITSYVRSVNTPDYDSVLYKVVNPDISALLSIPMKYWVTDGTSVTEMSPGEKATVDAADLPAYKQQKINSLQNDIDIMMVNQGYSVGVVHNLMSMYSDSNRMRPYRGLYLQPWVDWNNSVSNEIKIKQQAVNDASTLVEVDAVQIDTATLIAVDPGTTISGAVTIDDTTSLSNFLDGHANVVDPFTSVSGPFYLMQELVMRRDLYNDSTNPLYIPDHTSILGPSGILQDAENRILNIETIHDKTGWHEQQVIKSLYSRPKDLLVYYGWLNSFNSALNGWSNEKVAVDMARYSLIVFGDGIEDPSHGDYANTQIIIPRIKTLNPDTLIFGYVATPSGTFNTKASQWDTLEVHGIFFDEAGYDFGVDRTDFNLKVDYVHALTYANLCFANAWNSDHILGTANDVSYPNTTYNPGLVESNLTKNDWILMESFPINVQSYSGNYESGNDWNNRGTKVKDLRSIYGVNVAGVCIIDNTNVDGSNLFNFGYTSASMWSFESFGTSDNNYASSSAAVKYWTRPNWYNIRSLWNLYPSIVQSTDSTNIYHRFTENSHLMLNFTSEAQSSTVTVFGA